MIIAYAWKSCLNYDDMRRCATLYTENHCRSKNIPSLLYGPKTHSKYYTEISVPFTLYLGLLYGGSIYSSSRPGSFTAFLMAAASSAIISSARYDHLAAHWENVHFEEKNLIFVLEKVI